MVERLLIPDGLRLHPMRSQDLTASDIGAAVGKDPYKSALKLYAEKTGQIMADPDTPIMRRGRWLEGAVLEALRETHPDWMIKQPRVYLRDPVLRLGATPDATAFTDEEGMTNIQCKVVSRPAFERDWADGPPLHYRLQTLTEGMLMDAARSMLAVLVIDTYNADLKEFPVPRHAGAEAQIRNVAARFWENVAAGKRPAVDTSRDADVVDALYPVSVPEPVLDLSGDNRLADILPARAALKREISAMQKDVDRLDTEIKSKLAEAEVATLPGWRISWKTQHRDEKLVPASDFRVLRISEVAEQEQAA